MNLRILASASVVALLLSAPAFAQNPLVGAWEHTSARVLWRFTRAKGCLR